MTRLHRHSRGPWTWSRYDTYLYIYTYIYIPEFSPGFKSQLESGFCITYTCSGVSLALGVPQAHWSCESAYTYSFLCMDKPAHLTHM